MQNDIEKLENKLAAMHNRKYCKIVSRGTTAIYLALKALDSKKTKVVMPAIQCMSPANATLYAGLGPVYCDVSLKDFNMCSKDLKDILEKKGNIRAVLLPHIYGQPADLDIIINLTRKYNVPLIEDAAQALGGRYKGNPLGSFGEFSILSFGHTKILDAGGGGAILFDRKVYADMIKAYYDKLPEKAQRHSKLSKIYSKLYYNLATFYREDQRFGKLYFSFPSIFKDLYLFKGVKKKIIQSINLQLLELKTHVKKRKKNADVYRKYLKHEKIKHPAYKWQGVYWRYSFLIKGCQQYEIAEAIRKHNIDVSNWYPPLHHLYELESRTLKNADYIGSHVFNLWVAPSHTRENIKKISNIVLRVIEES